MKRLLLLGLTVAALVFSGCSQKNPEVDMTKKDYTDVSTADVSSADKKASGISGMEKTDMDSNVMQTPDTASVIAMMEGKVNKIYFDFDKYNIREDMKANIEMNAEILNTDEAMNFSVKVEGNADEWGTDEYNYALGLKRAKSVKDSLGAQGISTDRIMLVSYGESNPACTESNKACWDQNRRVEFKILP